MPHRVFYTMVRLTSYGIKNNLDNDSGLVGQVKAYMEGVFDMKKWFRPVRVIKKRIDISVNMDDYRIDDPVVKAAKPSNKKSKKISDDALSFYIGFLQYVILQVICNCGLKITKLYLSKKTCTCYIAVKHYGYIHDEKVKYNIEFRVNNQINYTLKRGTKADDGWGMAAPKIKEIRVGKFESSSHPMATLYLNLLCRGIRENDEAAEATLAAWREQYCDADRPQKGDAVE